MTYLPSLPYTKGPIKQTQTIFGGYNHTAGAGDGELYDMENLTSDYYPLLASRAPRYWTREIAEPHGLYARDVLMWVDGNDFYYDGEVKGNVTADVKTFCCIGQYIIILPDKVFYNMASDAFGNLEETYQAEAGKIRFTDGTLYEEPAEGCCLVTEGEPFNFKVGDAVTISGCVSLPENNKTPVIREISEDQKTLTFYEFVFTTGEEDGAVTVARTVPEMDHLCECDNRIWGCKGDTIYASKLGDPTNFNVFEGLATDSFAVDVGSAGDFTAACNYLGYPTFFKEDAIHKIYGSKPSNYQAIASASLGVAAGSAKSLAVAGEVLFYLSRAGVVAYAGGIPQTIGAAFGESRYCNGVAGSDGVKYYVSLTDTAGEYHLFAYDTRLKQWHREDNTAVLDFAYCGNHLYMLTGDHKIWTCGSLYPPSGAVAAEAAVPWFAEFGDFIERSPDKKGVSKIQARLELEAGATVTLSIRFDNESTYTPISTRTATEKLSYSLPIIPRRNDHYRLKFSGFGGCRIYSLSREFYHGSDV